MLIRKTTWNPCLMLNNSSNTSLTAEVLRVAWVFITETHYSIKCSHQLGKKHLYHTAGHLGRILYLHLLEILGNYKFLCSRGFKMHGIWKLEEWKGGGEGERKGERESFLLYQMAFPTFQYALRICWIKIGNINYWGNFRSIFPNMGIPFFI